MTKTNVKTLKTKCFLLITRENVTKKHDESLSFDYPIYINIYIYILSAKNKMCWSNIKYKKKHFSFSQYFDCST